MAYEFHPGPVTAGYRLAKGIVRRAKRAVTGCDMNVVYEPEFGFAYVPVPKVACSTVKEALFRATRSGEFDAIVHRDIPRVHFYYHIHQRYHLSETQLSTLDMFRFTVIRDPVKRLISAYTNRVQDKRDLERQVTDLSVLSAKCLPLRPDIETFALNLTTYAAANASLKHHLRSQAEILRDPDLYDRIYQIEELDLLASDFEAQTGRALNLRRANPSVAAKPTLGPSAQRAVRQFYADDYAMFPQLLKSARQHPVASASAGLKTAS
ncbi:MAG: sulfotransferase family 2 domain-containing protein [Pseudomonadota bacterium]